MMFIVTLTVIALLTGTPATIQIKQDTCPTVEQAQAKAQEFYQAGLLLREVRCDRVYHL